MYLQKEANMIKWNMGQFRMINFFRIYRPMGQEATFLLTYTSTILHENVYAAADAK